MRIDERRGEVKESKGGAERQDQQERRTIPPRRRGCRTDGAINFSSLDVFGPLWISVLIRVRPWPVFIRG
jgi:hypothetical protein